MTAKSSNTKRIAKNTVSLYIRSLVNLFVGLFTVSIVLKALGEEDYGIYTVVGGLLGFLTFVSGALSTGSQRFFSYVIGVGDNDELHRTFRSAFSIFLLLAFGIVIIAEIAGNWYISNYLNVNPSRLSAANIIFQFVIVSTAITMISTPFMTAIMAHEDMHIFGKMAFLEAGLKITTCILVVLSPLDKLITYSLLLLIVCCIIQTVYISFAYRRYPECRFKVSWDKKKMKEITSFSGWNLFGSIAFVSRNQGVSVMLNLFFGPIVNAAQGIATTIRTVSGTFSQNFSSALSPQIVKHYAAKDYDNLSSLLHRGSRMTYYLMLVVVTPLVFCLDFILQLWLGPHSDHMTAFCKIMLIEALIDSISTPLASANQATGKIALYQFLIGFFGLLTLPIAYIFLRIGYTPETVFIVSVILQVFIVGVRILFLRRIYPGALRGAVKNILIPCAMVSLIVFGLCLLLRIDVKTIVDALWAIPLYIGICVLVIWFIGMKRGERTKIQSFIKGKIKLR